MKKAYTSKPFSFYSGLRIFVLNLRLLPVQLLMGFAFQRVINIVLLN